LFVEVVTKLGLVQVWLGLPVDVGGVLVVGGPEGGVDCVSVGVSVGLVVGSVGVGVCVGGFVLVSVGVGAGVAGWPGAFAKS
jgi:hypothetical protein